MAGAPASFLELGIRMGKTGVFYFLRFNIKLNNHKGGQTHDKRNQ